MPRGFFFLAVVLPAMCHLVADGVQRPAVAGVSETPSAGHVVVSIFEELWVDARVAAEREFSVSSVPGGQGVGSAILGPLGCPFRWWLYRGDEAVAKRHGNRRRTLAQ